MISVATPSYQRLHTLERLWVSLCNQIGNEPFKWILVDDGSTDGTQAWFEALPKTDRFSTQYILQPNQGKHVAVNTAIKHATGEWVLIVDSDDALTPDAIQTATADLADHAHYEKFGWH